MKTLKLFLVVSALVIGISSCGTKASNTLPGYTWKITSFVDNSGDQTSQFEGYQFAFKSNNQLRAMKGQNEMIGEWSIVENNGERLIINITGDSNVDQLKDDWYVRDVSIDVVKVDNGDNNLTSITFDKMP